MSKNIDQVFTANPITTNASTDLMYFGQSPYGPTDDAAMTYANFAAQFSGATPLQVQQSAFNHGSDIGAVDAYSVPLSPAVTLYTDGLLVSFTPANTNLTTTPTLLLNALGAQSIVLPSGGAVQAGDLSNLSTSLLIYNSLIDSFILLNPVVSSVAPPAGATPLQVQQSAFNAATVAGADDAFVVTLSPAVTSLTDGLQIILNSGSLQNLTTSPTLQVNALAPVPIQLINSAIAAEDIQTGGTYLLVYNLASNVFKLINPSVSTANTFLAQGNVYNSAIDAGAANAYAITLNPTPPTVALGFPVIMQPANTNTTISTITINGVTYPILTAAGNDIAAGDIVQHQLAFLLYSDFFSGFVLMNPSSTGSGFATINQVQHSLFNTGAATGGVTNAYQLTLNPDPTPLNAGFTITFLPDSVNTGDSTLSVNGGTAYPVLRIDGAQVLPGDLSINFMAVVVYYDGTQTFTLLNPATGYGGVTPAQVQSSAFNEGIDTGTADNYIVTLSPAITSYTDGLTISFTPLADNTTTTPVINVNSVGAITIVRPGNLAIVAGDILSSSIAYLVYSASSNNFVLLNPPASSGGSGITPAQVQQSAFNSGTDTGTANAYEVSLSPAATSYTEGMIVAFTPANANTSPNATLDLNSLGVASPIVRPGQILLLPGDLNVAQLSYVVYDASQGAWVLLNPSHGNPIDIQQSAFNTGNDTGAADAYAVDLNPAVTSYTNGLMVLFTPTNTSLTTTPTLNVNSQGALIITRPNGVPAVIGDLSAGNIAYVIYSANANTWVLLTI